MADNQSPELKETIAGESSGVSVGGDRPASETWPSSLHRPPVPALPSMLAAIVGDDPAQNPTLPPPVRELHATRAVLPAGLEAYARRSSPVSVVAAALPDPDLKSLPRPPPPEPSSPASPPLVAPWPSAPALAVPLAELIEHPANPPSARIKFDVWAAVRLARRALKWAAIAFAVWFALTIGLIALYRFVNPPFSMLMLSQRLQGGEIDHTWVPLDAISPNLRRAVITSEDGKFCSHWGFDLGEIRAAMQSGGEGFGRGASTISQQVAKNMFLWPGKSYVRKGLEVPLTLAIEALWPKRRIFEVYLNVAEWGPGVFGAEAASQHAYSHSAAQLNEREAALLAVALPNPIARDIADPESGVARLATRLQTRMRMPVMRGCVSTTRAP